MALIIGTLLALLSLGVALYPFARRRWGWGQTDPAAAAGTDGMESAAATAAATAAADTAPDTASLADIYAALRTLQLEHELGRIPDSLYQEQLNDYRTQAALILRQQAQESAAESAAANAASADAANPANAATANPASADAANPANDDAVLESEIRAARAALRQAAGNAAVPPERD